MCGSPTGGAGGGRDTGSWLVLFREDKRTSKDILSLLIVHNVGYPKAIGAVSVINHFFGRDNITLGAFKGNFGDKINGIYVDDLVDNFPSPVKHYDQVEEAVTVLRRTLQAAEVVEHLNYCASVKLGQCRTTQLCWSPLGSSSTSPLSSSLLQTLSVPSQATSWYKPR